MDVLINSRAAFSATDNITRLQENGRTAVEILGIGLRRSGYLGGNSDITTIAGSLGMVAAGTTCVDDDNTWGRMVSQGVFGLNDTKAGYACIDDDYLRGDILTVRYASPWQVATGDFVSTRMYLRSSLFEGKLFVGSNTATAANTVLDTPQRQHEILSYAYYVADTGRSCNSVAIPGLFREALDADNQPVSQELISGIEDIQFQYSVGNQYVDADNVGDWDNVVSVKLWVLVRGECPETGFTDSRTYVYGDAADYTPADSFRRSLYSTVVALRN
jgi:type IV pilus assembly protein PilW